jgi:hypothetical protein
VSLRRRVERVAALIAARRQRWTTLDHGRLRLALERLLKVDGPGAEFVAGDRVGSRRAWLNALAAKAKEPRR